MNPNVHEEAGPSSDQRVTLRGVNWQGFESFLRTRGESKSVRVAYLDGELELMSPSAEHEARAEMLGLLLVAWALTHTRAGSA